MKARQDLDGLLIGGKKIFSRPQALTLETFGKHQ
jgi:hypothetical protein